MIPDRFASHGAKIFRAGLAAHAVDLGFIRKLLAFIERAHAGALDGADVHEHVVAAVVGLNEAKTLGRVEPLNCSGRHLTSPRCAYALTPARPSRELDPISAMSWGGEPVRRDQQGKSTIRMGGVYTALPQIASANRIRRQAKTHEAKQRPDQPSRLICSS